MIYALLSSVALKITRDFREFIVNSPRADQVPELLKPGVRAELKDDGRHASLLEHLKEPNRAHLRAAPAI